MTRVGIDMTALLPQATGVDRYILELVHALARVDRANHYVLFVNRADLPRLGELPETYRTLAVWPRARPFRLLFQQAALPLIARSLKLDVLHSPAFLLPLRLSGVAQLLSVHDMTFFSRPECQGRLHRSRAFRAAVLASLRRADLVCVPSEHVRRQVLARVPQLDPGRVRVLPYGVPPRFRPEAGERGAAAAARLGIPAPYVLHVGTLQPRKNLERLLEAYGRLAAEGTIAEHLVLAGRAGWGCGELLERARRPDLRRRVHVLGYVDEADLPGLYAGARAFVYPSLEEGFGFPPLEAMASGVPTLVASGSAPEEHLGGSALLFPPGDVSALASALRRLLRDEPLRARCARAGLDQAAVFRWDASAGALARCYEEAAGSRRAAAA